MNVWRAPGGRDAVANDHEPVRLSEASSVILTSQANTPSFRIASPGVLHFSMS